MAGIRDLALAVCARLARTFSPRAPEISNAAACVRMVAATGKSVAAFQNQTPGLTAIYQTNVLTSYSG